MAAEPRPYIIRTYDRWIILVLVLVAGWFLFRPIFAFTVYYRGLSFERMIRLETAAHYYAKSIALYPRIPEGWIALSELYYMWTPASPQYYEKGLTLIHSGLAFNPHNETLAFELGRFYFRAKDYRSALPALLETTRANPKNLFAWDYAAWASLKLGRRADAVRYWSEVLKIEPTNIAAKRALKVYGT